MPDRPTSAVFGATGFIGRWLVKDLLDHEGHVLAPVRDLGRTEALTTWLAAHGTETDRLAFTSVDFAVDGLGIMPGGEWADVIDVHNTAGAFAFGMTSHAAYEGNVRSAERVVRFSSTLPSLRRLVHVSGYRVGGQDPASAPWSEARRRKEHARLGPYEASKVESDAVVQAAARDLGVPFTIVNPSTVIGHSETGETSQYIGLADTLKDLWNGKLVAIPGNDQTFVPVVTVDHLAGFMTLVPTTSEAVDRSYWVLDDATPTLPALIQLAADCFGVRAPRLRAPVGLVKRLPRRISGADPETLSFLSSDRYPVEAANELAARHGLKMPDTRTSLERWATYLADHHFAARR